MTMMTPLIKDEFKIMSCIAVDSYGVYQHRRIVYLMIGLPGCGKSATAKRLVPQGHVFETDEFFYLVGDDHSHYTFIRRLQKTAGEWNLRRFKVAVSVGLTPIVVDRGNTLTTQTKQYVCYAVEAGYEIEFAEPDSPWWPEIRELLKDKEKNRTALDKWAVKLAEITPKRIRPERIRDRMDMWQCDVTIDDILRYKGECEHGPTTQPESTRRDLQVVLDSIVERVRALQGQISKRCSASYAQAMDEIFSAY